MVELSNAYHVPVMAAEVLKNLLVDENGSYLDGTLGGGGHSERILKRLGPGGTLIGFDRDNDAVTLCGEKFKSDNRMVIHHKLFSEIDSVCEWNSLSGVLLDLGVSMHQLSNSSRGFSFEKGTALDMRMDQGKGISALEYLETVPERELAWALAGNSDLKKSKQLAAVIKKNLEIHKDSCSIQDAVKEVYASNRKKWPSLFARVFQAVRMEVNNELTEIAAAIDASVKCVKTGGRICVLSYHSAEDRVVKRMFRKYEKSCLCPPSSPICNCGADHQKLRRVFSKPMLPSEEEISVNISSRSAKLRVVERVGK